MATDLPIAVEWPAADADARTTGGAAASVLIVTYARQRVPVDQIQARYDEARAYLASITRTEEDRQYAAGYAETGQRQLDTLRTSQQPSAQPGPVMAGQGDRGAGA